MCIVRKSGFYYIYGGDTIVQDLKVFMNETDIMNGVFFFYNILYLYIYRHIPTLNQYIHIYTRILWAQWAYMELTTKCAFRLLFICTNI